MKLGTKLFVGFGSTLAITIALGSIAVVKMKSTSARAADLARKTVPESRLAADIDNRTKDAMLAARTYGFSGDEKQLQACEAELARLKESLAAAQSLVDKYPDLTRFKEELSQAVPKFEEYTRLIADTASKMRRVVKIRGETLPRTAAVLVKNLDDLLERQHAALNSDIASKVDGEKLTERGEKVLLIARVLSLTNQCRVAAYKAQALRDTSLMMEGQAMLKEVDGLLARLQGLMKVPADIKEVETVKAAAAEYGAAMEALKADMAALDEIGARRARAGVEFGAMMQSVLERGLERTTAESDASMDALTSASTLMLWGLGLAALVGVSLALGITRSITGPIRRIIDALSCGAQQTGAASTQVSSASQALAQGASEQAASIEETSSSLEEISSMTRKNADTAHQASTLSGDARSAADKGIHAMGKMSTAIDQIQKSAVETAKIIKVIDEIAFQTNLLALNAAVEAARAGEAGKGFAVVAEEVRNLAMRSAEAARNTSSLIEESVGNARNGVVMAADVDKVLVEINQTAQKVNALVGEIAAASSEQAKGIDQVSQAVAQMEKVTQSNAANAEESASAAEELSSQAQQLQVVVGQLVNLVGSASTPLQTGAQAAVPAARPSHPAPLNKSGMDDPGAWHKDDIQEFSKAA